MTLVVLLRHADYSFSENIQIESIIHKLRIQACFVFPVALLGLKPSAIDWKLKKTNLLAGGEVCACLETWFYANLHLRQNLSPNVLSETLELYIYIYIKRTIDKYIYIHLFPILLGGGTNIGPYWSPLSSSPASAKVFCQGLTKIIKNICC